MSEAELRQILISQQFPEHDESNRAQSPPQTSRPRARGKDAVVQWVLLIPLGVAFLCLGTALLTATIGAVVGWVHTRDASQSSVAWSDLRQFGFAYAVGLGLFILSGKLARDRIYRLIGKKIPPFQTADSPHVTPGVGSCGDGPEQWSEPADRISTSWPD